MVGLASLERGTMLELQRDRFSSWRIITAPQDQPEGKLKLTVKGGQAHPLLIHCLELLGIAEGLLSKFGKLWRPPDTGNNPTAPLSPLKSGPPHLSFTL